MFKKNEEFYKEENAKMKGDGQPYLEWLNEEYDKMTDEERKEVDEIGKKLNTILGIDDDDDDDDFVKSNIYGFNENIYTDFKSALKIAAKSTNEGEELAIYTKDNKFITIHSVNSENAIRAGYIPLVGYTEMLCVAEDIEDPMKGLRKYYKDIGDINKLEFLEELFYNNDKKEK